MRRAQKIAAFRSLLLADDEPALAGLLGDDDDALEFVIAEHGGDVRRAADALRAMVHHTQAHAHAQMDALRKGGGGSSNGNDAA